MHLWYGQCLVCHSEYEKETSEDSPPFHRDGKSYGTFCPECRSRKLTAPGVVHFYRKMVKADDGTVRIFDPKLIHPVCCPRLARGGVIIWQDDKGGRGTFPNTWVLQETLEPVTYCPFCGKKLQKPEVYEEAKVS